MKRRKEKWLVFAVWRMIDQRILPLVIRNWKPDTSVDAVIDLFCADNLVLVYLVLILVLSGSMYRVSSEDHHS